MALAIDVYGHGSVSWRKKCRWWLKKYTAVSKVWSPLQQKKDTDRDCSYATTKAEINCAIQAAYIYSGGWGAPGTVFCWSFVTGRGLAVSDLTKLIIESEEFQSSDGDMIENSQIESNDTIQMQEGLITIPNINGFFETFSDDIISMFEITVWEANDDTINFIQDTVITEEKIIWYGKVEILNGEMQLLNFTTEDIIFTREGTHSKVMFNNLTKVISYNPQGILLENVVVNMSSHAEPNEQNLFNNSLDSSALRLKIGQQENPDVSFNFEVYPNPALEEVNIKLLNSIGDIEISLYDYSGKFVDEIYSGLSDEKEQTISYSIDPKKVTKGIYLISVKINGKIFLKKLTIY